MNGDQERDAALSRAVRLREDGRAEEARVQLLALAERYPQDAGIAYRPRGRTTCSAWSTRRCPSTSGR